MANTSSGSSDGSTSNGSTSYVSASDAQSATADVQRLEALRRYDILDTEPEPAFDRVTDLAARFFEAPVAIINFVTKERQWFKSAIGFGEQETNIDVSFCAYTVAAEEIFVVEDLAADERFADNPYVQEEGIRFYAGVPLTTPGGHKIGTVCILDHQPRSLSESDLETLSDLAAMVVGELELRREQAERKRAMRRLRRNREQLQRAEQMAQVGGWEYDVDSSTLSWTDETYRIHGLSPGRSMNVDEALSFYVSKDRPVIQSHFRGLIEDGGEYDLELQIQRPDGKRRWIRTKGKAHQENGTTVRVSGAIQDITERHRHKEELQRRKEVLQTIFDNIPVVIVLVDEEGEVLLANSRFEDALGWSREAMEHRSDALKKLFPPPSVRRNVLEEIQAATGEWGEFQVQARDGSLTEMMGAVVALADGRRVCIGADITEKKERQKRLRLLEAAIEHARLPILITEADPLDEPGPKVVYANPAVDDVTGYSPAEMRGRTPRVLQGEGTDRAVLDRIRAALDAEEPIREVVRNYTKGGTMYWNDLYIAPVPNEKGEVTHYVSVQDDVTNEIRRREKLREAKEVAEEADRVKSALITNMNHELRTPLTSIISFSRLIADTPELAESFADKILGGGKRLLRTLNAVMDFAELEGGKTPGPLEHVDLVRQARLVAETFEEQAHRKNLTMDVEGPGNGVPVYLDSHFVERVLTHLVSNAVKFTEEGGEVRVVARPDDDAAEIRVIDTGIGIPIKMQPKVFEEFYQVSKGDDRTHEGNGIGLAIVKRMVDRMEGAVHLESKPGEGTEVTVRLPLK